MKKMEYLAPEIDVLEIKYSKMLCASGEDEPGYGEEGVPGVNDPD